MRFVRIFAQTGFPQFMVANVLATTRGLGKLKKLFERARADPNTGSPFSIG
jgi:hypothetical protein